MKKISKILLAFLMVGTAFVALASCKEENEVVLVSATFDKTTYITGQDMNLEQCVLVYEENGVKSEIALNGEGVVVSGYDKTKSGKQTITITYKEKTIQVDVNVTARMTVENAVTDYFVGDDFNNSQGTLKIKNDDGSVQTVKLNSDKVTVTGFDSTVAGTPIVTFTYKDGTVEYSTTLKVNVFAKDEVKFTKPSNRSYKSYHTELDLSGGYFTVKAGDNVRYENLTQDMVSGFNPTAVSATNPTETQTITVTYGEDTFTYEVEVKYSVVSDLKTLAESFADIDWESEEAPEISEEDGAKAMQAANLYYDLETVEKNVITEDEWMSIVRVTTIYAFEKWKTEAESYSLTFKVLPSSIQLVCKDYTQTKNDLVRLQDSEAQIYVYSNILMRFIEDYSEDILYGEKTMLDHLGALYTDNVYKLITKILAYMIQTYELLDETVVPKAWVKDDLPTYAEEIETAVDFMLQSGYANNTYSFIHEIIANWRENGDYFDIIYSYYYYHVEEDPENTAQITVSYLFQKLPLPTQLQTIYNTLASGHSVALQFKNNAGEAVWADTWSIFQAYYKTIALANELKTNGSDFYKELYSYLDLDYFIDYNLTYVALGYEAQSKELFGDEEFESLWQAYVALFDLELVDEKGKFTFEENAEALDAVFSQFVNASPSWQYSFIASMYNNYRALDKFSREGLLALDFSNGYVYSDFVYIYANYFIEQFVYEEEGEEKVYETAKSLCEDLFKAIEIYALLYKSNTKEDFVVIMGDMQDKYESLEGTEYDVFRDVLGDYYDKYIALYEKCTSTDPVDLKEYQTTFNALEDALTLFFELGAIVNDTFEEEDVIAHVRPLMLATYEQITEYVEQIKACTDTSIVYAYYHDVVFTADLDFEGVTQNVSLEYAVWKARAAYIHELVNEVKIGIVNDDAVKYYPAWKFYSSSNLKELGGAVYAIMLAGYGETTVEGAQVVSGMQAYYQAQTNGGDQRTLFGLLEYTYYYHEGLLKFFESLSAEGKTLGEKLVAAERAYFAYNADKDDADLLAAFTTAMQAVETAKGSVTDTDEYTTYLKSMYDFCKTQLDALPTQA